MSGDYFPPNIGPMKRCIDADVNYSQELFFNQLIKTLSSCFVNFDKTDDVYYCSIGDFGVDRSGKGRTLKEAFFDAKAQWDLRK